eukprot:CAMPEP_0170062262 /NCGR_PEP_ID=MMETSP0019_2-20121128/3546_1 /TAXON_ID=98059 /ORGANISM="Dinobryon sp., Strain UTEXLB2267" /LENGTH=182 /DNA_ID=CAMNT_0010268349 /DNA_START=195 /DNA_END=743 /DNA_ORIENTATION=-
MKIKSGAKSEKNMSIYESGINGERTTFMLHRLPLFLNSITDLKFVIILGGTNDLGSHYDTKKILGNLIRMHKMVLQKSNIEDPIYSIVVSIPPCGWNIDESVRQAVNIGLKEFAKNCSHMVAFVDSDEIFDVLKNQKKQILWSSDKVHFSDMGYDELGNVLFQTMIEFLEKKKTNSIMSNTC